MQDPTGLFTDFLTHWLFEPSLKSPFLGLSLKVTKIYGDQIVSPW